MANEQPLDLETMDLDELARLASGQTEQPRDEQGRFTKQEQAASEEEQGQNGEQGEAPPDEIVYRRVIDLGDGSGVQVFEAASLEELVEKLGTAQENATRKIKELSQQKKTEEVAQISEDEEFVLSQQFLQSPTKAFRELFKRNTGMTIEEFKEKTESASRLSKEQAEFNAGQEFQQLRPEYFPSHKNAEKIGKWLKMNSLDATVENIDKAFEDLNESGLLQSRPQTNDATSNTEGAGNSRIANPGNTVGSVRRAASGVTSRRSVPVTPQAQPTEDDLYNMPLEQLERLAAQVKL